MRLSLRGEHIIASTFCRGGVKTFSAVNPSNGAELEPGFLEATPVEVDRAASLASEAFNSYRAFSPGRRATFLSCIATELQSLGDSLIARANLETALPRQRLEKELLRTVSQLKMFSDQVRQGAYLGIRLERSEPDRKPQPKPDIRAMNVPLGPVAVFGASNFPLAFSVAGGDTASALAAGCPVIVKGHPAHPGTSELAAMAIVNAVKKSGIPEGVFSMLQSTGHSIGKSLASHPLIKALAFTGTLSGGRVLFDIASSRPEPIPVYAEMGSINPIFLLPSAVAENREALAEGLAASMTMGVGQFCTAPGLIILMGSTAADDFIKELSARLSTVPEGVMLHRDIKHNFLACVSKLAEVEGVKKVFPFQSVTGGCNVSPILMSINAQQFVRSPELAEEVFGPAAMVVLCNDLEDMLKVAQGLPGQLTATIHGEEQEIKNHLELIRILECKAGRLIINDYPTGVEVCRAMHHGGPYPATTDSRSTSVGTEAVMRFLRPVCYQNFPQSILPQPLQDKEGVLQ